MQHKNKILFASVACILIFVFGGIIGAKITIWAINEKNTIFQPINHLKKTRKTTDLISSQGVQAHIKNKSLSSALALEKVNLDWHEYSVNHRKFACSELDGIRSTFDVLRSQLKAMNPDSSTLKNIEKTLSRHEQCKLNSPAK